MNNEQTLNDNFRLAMRGYAGGVAIVTSMHNDERQAMTLTSAMSLSMDPLSVVVAINKNAGIHSALSHGAGYCLNILSNEQIDIANACSNPKLREQRFELAKFDNQHGVPYLVDAQANLFCTQDGNLTYGTHTLFVGKVNDVIVSDSINPLLYLDGKYAQAQQE